MFNLKIPFVNKQNDMAFITTISRIEQKEIERIFARVFSSDDGKKVIAYLQFITFHRALNANSDSDLIRYTEGQRSCVANVLRLIDRGRKG